MNRRAFLIAPLALLIPSRPAESVKVIQPLVPVAEVKREAAETMRKLRTELLNISDRNAWVATALEVAIKAAV